MNAPEGGDADPADDVMIRGFFTTIYKPLATILHGAFLLAFLLLHIPTLQADLKSTCLSQQFDTFGGFMPGAALIFSKWDFARSAACS